MDTLYAVNVIKITALFKKLTGVENVQVNHLIKTMNLKIIHKYYI